MALNPVRRFLGGVGATENQGGENIYPLTSTSIDLTEDLRPRSEEEENLQLLGEEDLQLLEEEGFQFPEEEDLLEGPVSDPTGVQTKSLDVDFTLPPGLVEKAARVTEARIGLQSTSELGEDDQWWWEQYQKTIQDESILPPSLRGTQGQSFKDFKEAGRRALKLRSEASRLGVGVSGRSDPQLEQSIFMERIAQRRRSRALPSKGQRAINIGLGILETTGEFTEKAVLRKVKPRKRPRKRPGSSQLPRLQIPKTFSARNIGSGEGKLRGLGFGGSYGHPPQEASRLRRIGFGGLSKPSKKSTKRTKIKSPLTGVI